jgi:oligosaccharide repeat unit polymerase
MAQYQFSAYDWSLITDEDLQWAIILNVGGAGLVLLFYQLSHFISRQGTFVRRAPNLLLSIPSARLGFAPGRLFLFIWATLIFLAVFYLFNFSIILHGILDGILVGNNTQVIAGRYGIMENYMFILVVYNVVPFLAVALWLLYRIRRSNTLRFCTISFNIVAVISLILLFQKRPLLLFLLCLCIASFGTNQFKIQRTSHQVNHSLSMKRNNRSSSKKLLIYGVILFAILLGLFYAQTSIGRDNESLYETVTLLSTIAAWNIIGGLSLPSAMYVHYFPTIEPYYGLSNIKLLSSLLGFELYLNSNKVYQYFALGKEEGSLALSALMDFYASFGLIGWFLGAALIGILLNRLDDYLARMQPNVAKILLTIFMFVFVFYLSHASLANSLLGYGGGIFVLLWIALKMNFRVVKQPVRHIGPFRDIE